MCNCILLSEKLSQFKDHILITNQALQLQLGPLENTLCGGQPAALVLTDVKIGVIHIALSGSSKHDGYRRSLFQ